MLAQFFNISGMFYSFVILGSLSVRLNSLSLLEGSVENYINPCLYAIAALDDEYVQWPSAEEQSSYRRQSHYNFFEGTIGLVDGTIFPLALAPTLHKEDYWLRKSVYALNSLIVSDRNHRIIYAVHGWCGSAHNQHVFKNSKVCLSDYCYLQQSSDRNCSSSHSHRGFSPLANTCWPTRLILPPQR
jgi:hypothetical protein